MGAVSSCLAARRADPERAPLFPAPSTVLTPPRRHRALALEPSHARTQSAPFFSFSGLGLDRREHGSGKPVRDASVEARPGNSTRDSSVSARSVGSAAALSEQSRARIGTISRAYGSRMFPVHSQPTTPHAPCFAAPHRPPAPTLGRSSSEPRSLAGLGLPYGGRRATYGATGTGPPVVHRTHHSALEGAIGTDQTDDGDKASPQYVPRHMRVPDCSGATTSDAPATAPLGLRRRSATTGNLGALSAGIVGSVEDGAQGRGRSPRPDWTAEAFTGVSLGAARGDMPGGELPEGDGGGALAVRAWLGVHRAPMGSGAKGSAAGPRQDDAVLDAGEDVLDRARAIAAADQGAEGAPDVPTPMHPVDSETGADEAADAPDADDKHDAPRASLSRHAHAGGNPTDSAQDADVDDADDVPAGEASSVVHLDLGLRGLGTARRARRKRRSTASS